MAMATQQARKISLAERMQVRRSRGAVSGILLMLLGIWGGLVPFAGPIFDYAYTPSDSWHYTIGRLWLEILPGAVAVLGGLILVLSGHRAVAMLGGWLGALAGAWFVVGQPLSTLWNHGVPAAGVPASSETTRAAMEQIGFFLGLGVLIVFLSSLALGRLSVVGLKDIQRLEDEPPVVVIDERTAPYPASGADVGPGVMDTRDWPATPRDESTSAGFDGDQPTQRYPMSPDRETESGELPAGSEPAVDEPERRSPDAD